LNIALLPDFPLFVFGCSFLVMINKSKDKIYGKIKYVCTSMQKLRFKNKKIIKNSLFLLILLCSLQRQLKAIPPVQSCVNAAGGGEEKRSNLLRDKHSVHGISHSNLSKIHWRFYYGILIVSLPVMPSSHIPSSIVYRFIYLDHSQRFHP